MSAGPVGVKHPAKKWFLLTILTAFISFILSLIAIFVPWSWKNTAVFERSTVGLWWNCIEYTNSPLGAYRCLNNDVNQVGSVCGGSFKCRGYFINTQVSTVLSCVYSFMAIGFAGFILGKLWSKPIIVALYAALMTFSAWSAALVSFLMWVVYVEQDCQPGNPLFPLKGYSWGWILMVVATFFTFLAMLFAHLGLFSILKFKPFIPHEEPTMYPAMSEAPVYQEVTPVCSPYCEPMVRLGSARPSSGIGGPY